MNNPSSSLHLYKSLGLPSFQLPNKLNVWKIGSEHIQSISSHCQQAPIITEDRHFVLRQYSWSSDGPVIVFSADKTGMGFESAHIAKQTIPKLRRHVFPPEQGFWFLAIEQEEMDLLLAMKGIRPYPSSRFSQSFELPSDFGYISCFGGDGGHWFRTLGRIQQYERFLVSMDALTNV